MKARGALRVFFLASHLPIANQRVVRWEVSTGAVGGEAAAHGQELGGK